MNRSEFRFIGNVQRNLFDYCCVILRLEGLGKLQHLPQEELLAWGAHLRKFQDAESGLFVDPHWMSSHQASSDNDSSYLTRQLTYFALQALDALDTKAPYPLRFLDEFVGVEPFKAWAEALGWSKPLLQSDRIMFLLASLIYRAEVEQDRQAPRLFHIVLDWLDATQDEKTGLWNIQPHVSFRNAAVAAYRFIPFYQYVHRPLKRISRIIDTVFDLLQPDGWNAVSISSEVYENLTLIDILATLTRQVGYREDEIKRLLLECYRRIKSAENKDEGSPFLQYKETEGELNKNSVWVTWLHLLALATIECTYPQDLPLGTAWRFRRWPALGYHRSTSSLSDHEREVLPLWIRPSRYVALSDNQGSSEQPAISVIVPCYNLGQYLHEAIESVLAQTFQDFEIIIVNDGSNDEFTRLLLANFDRPKTRVLHQVNRGLAAARNHGIRQAHGRFICCLDSDDLLRPEFFAKASAILEAQPEVGLVSGYFKMFDELDDVFQYKACVFPELLAYNQAIGVALFRREAWEKAGGYCATFSVNGIEDWDLWISILELGYRAEVIPEVILDYRIRPNQMSARMYQPEIWAQLCRELVMRHPMSYSKHAVEILVKHSTRWSELRDWVNGRERAIRWWERQVANWQQLAEEREQLIRDQQLWIAKLQEAQAWHQEQVVNQQQLAEDREQLIRDQQAWIAKLQEAQVWWQEQAANWKRLAQEREQLICEEQNVIDKLQDAQL